MLTLPCPNPNCDQVYHADEQHIGRNVKCSRCGTLIRIAPAQGHPIPPAPSVQEGPARADPVRKLVTIRAGAALLVGVAIVLLLWSATHRPGPLPTSPVARQISEPVPVAPRQLAQLVLPAVVLVAAVDAQGHWKQGSGFFVRADEVATNFHVIEGSVGGHVRIVGSRVQEGPFDVAAVDQARDLCLLRVSGVQAAPLLLEPGAGPRWATWCMSRATPKGSKGRSPRES